MIVSVGDKIIEYLISFVLNYFSQVTLKTSATSTERSLVSALPTKREIKDGKLVYYTISPDYCNLDSILGSVGTVGR